MPKRAGNPTDFESFLTWEALTDVLSYDPATGEFRWVKSPRNGWNGRIAGHVDHAKGGYRYIKLSGRAFLTSRLAWLHETKEWPAGVVDHINGNRIDDRWENLRDVEQAKNALNKSLNRNNLTGIPGVHAEQGQYIARIAIGRRRKFLGAFDTPEEAAAARREAEERYYGEYRRADAAAAKGAPTPRIRLRKDVSGDLHSGLNQAMLLRVISYDPATGEFRWLETTNGEVKIGPVAGKTNKQGYRVIGLGGRTFYGHRLAWLYVTGEWPVEMVDHRDGHPSNNAWPNLRAATASQNSANRIERPGASGVIGVYWHAKKQKWMAHAHRDNKKVHLGIFKTLEEARAARARFDEEYRGDFVSNRKSNPARSK